jgi:hypothetical protein
MADAIHGVTELGATQQDLIAAAVQRELQFRAQLSGTVSDVSRFSVKGAKSISFPKLTSFTAVNRTSAAAGDSTNLTSTVDQLDLDQKPYVAWIVDVNDEMQSTLSFQMESAKRAASAHGRFVDTAIITELEAAGTVQASAVGDMTRDITLDMRESYLSAEGLLEDSVWLVGVDQEKALLKIAEFTRNDIYGPNSVIKSGQIGTLYGSPVIRHNGLAADTYYLYGKDGMALGFQRSPSMDSESANTYGVGARRWAMDALFGVKALQVTGGFSPLIVKDNN